jgi:hypothetical protein
MKQEGKLQPGHSAHFIFYEQIYSCFGHCIAD